MKKISVVVSCYNEEQVLEQFYQTAAGVLAAVSWDYEILFVNDGSTDRSEQILNQLAEIDPKVRVIHFTRNFGHEAAMIAGIDHAEGDGVVCMDADLQHPPALLPQIIEKWEEGYDIISMARTKNTDAGWLKSLCSRLWYRILNCFSPIKFEENASDFFALSRRAADVLRKEYRENIRYLRGYVQCIGYPKTSIDFEAPPRAGGKSHYSFRKLVKFSITTMCGFSDIPLKLGIYAGLLAALAGFILLIYSLVMKFAFDAPSGYTTIIVALCFLFSLTLIVIGIIGEYISILLAEVKGRPIYLVRECRGGTSEDNSET